MNIDGLPQKEGPQGKPETPNKVEAIEQSLLGGGPVSSEVNQETSQQVRAAREPAPKPFRAVPTQLSELGGMWAKATKKEGREEEAKPKAMPDTDGSSEGIGKPIEEGVSESTENVVEEEKHVKPKLTQVAEIVPKEKEPVPDYAQLTFEELRDDKTAGPILERECWRVLQHNDRAWNKNDYATELTQDGYLQRRDGTRTELKPSAIVAPTPPGTPRGENLVRLATFRTRDQLLNIHRADESGVRDVTDHIYISSEKEEPGAQGIETQSEKEPVVPSDGAQDVTDHIHTEVPSTEVPQEVEEPEAVPETLPEEKNEATPETSPQELSLEEDGMVYLADKKKPETWKVLEENQVAEADPNDPSTWHVVPTERKPFRDISDPDFEVNQKPAEDPETEEDSPTPPPAPNNPSPVPPPKPPSSGGGGAALYEATFDAQGNKISGQGSNEELNMAPTLKKAEVSEKKLEKKAESPEVSNNVEAHKLARAEYRAHMKAVLAAEKEWMDAVTEHERRRHESGVLGKFMFDHKHGTDQVDKALAKYNELLDKTRSMREERTHAFLDKLQARGKKGETERTQGEKRIVALHEALLYSHIDQKASFVERMRVGEGLKKESTGRYLNFAKQKFRAYAALPMHKKIAVGTGLAAGFGLLLGASGVVTGVGAVGGAALYGGRRLVGGTLGMAAAIGTKLGINKLAENTAQREQQELKENFSKRVLSDALQEGVSIRKKERYTKNAGTAAAAAAAIAVGVGSSQAAAEVYGSDAIQNSAAGKTVAEYDAKFQNSDAGQAILEAKQRAGEAAHTLRGWYEGAKNKIDNALTPEDSAQVPGVSMGQEKPSVYTVEKGDNVWDILQKKLTEKGVLEGMTERQRTHIVDAIKDEIEGLSPEELKAMGITSGDPDLIRPGQTLDLSKVLDTQSIREAVESAPGVSAGGLQNVAESAGTPTPPSDVTGDTAVAHIAPEPIPESQKPFTSQSHLDAEAQKPFTSESHLFGKQAEVVGTAQTVETISSVPETTSASVSTDTAPVDEGLRTKDFAGGRTLEQVAQEFPDYRGEKSLASFEGIWEELKEQGKLDRHLLGRYPHLKSGWGPLSHVPVRDLYDNVQGLKYNIDGKVAIELSPQAEGELRSFVEATRQLPGGDMLEYCVEKNKTVGDYLNAVALREGIHNPEPTATLAAVDPAEYVQSSSQAVVEQAPSGNTQATPLESSSHLIDPKYRIEQLPEQVELGYVYWQEGGPSRVDGVNQTPGPWYKIPSEEYERLREAGIIRGGSTSVGATQIQSESGGIVKHGHSAGAPIDRPRYTKPLLEYTPEVEIKEPYTGMRMKVGLDARWGGKAPIDYEPVRLNDPLNPRVEGEYTAKYMNARFISKHPEVPEEWSTKTAGELMEVEKKLPYRERTFTRAWEAERRSIIDEAYRGMPVDLEPRDVQNLKQLSGEQALKELMDAEQDLREQRRYRDIDYHRKPIIRGRTTL